MARIIKVASTTTRTPQIANPFKKTAGTTNPFKYSNFEGNTLQFADVFEGFQPKETNKMKIIASSVAGSMNKMRTGFESVVNFVKRIGANVNSAWDYAKNTNVSDLTPVKSFNNLMNTTIEIPGTKTLDRVLHTPIELPKIKSVGETMTELKSKLYTGWDVLNTDVTDLGKTIGGKWNTLVEKVQPAKKISAETPVDELKQLWKTEIELESKGAV